MSNIFAPRITNWDWIWNGYNLGLVDEGNVDIEIITEPVTRGTTGKKVILDELIVAVKGEPNVIVPDISAAFLIEMCPWIGGVKYVSPPTPGSGIKQYGQLLTLHPHDMLTATTEDLNFICAVPWNPLKVAKRDGDKENPFKITFKLFPDFASLTGDTPKLIYGYLGAVPS